MRAIDELILNEIERASHFVQRLTGWTCYRQCGVVNILSILVLLHVLFIYPVWYAFLCFGAITIATYFLWFTLIPLEEIKAGQRIESGLRNPKKMDYLGRTIWNAWRLFFFLTPPYRLDSVVFMLWIAAEYLYTCDPLPPGNSKVKEWLTKLKSIRGLKPVSVGAGV